MQDNQIKGEYEVRHEDLISYQQAPIKLADTLDGFHISHISRLQNTSVDAPAALVATLALLADTSYRLTVAPLLSEVRFRSQLSSYDFNQL